MPVRVRGNVRRSMEDLFTGRAFNRSPGSMLKLGRWGQLWGYFGR